jgi:hypothetical protein
MSIITLGPWLHGILSGFCGLLVSGQIRRFTSNSHSLHGALLFFLNYFVLFPLFLSVCIILVSLIQALFLVAKIPFFWNFTYDIMSSILNLFRFYHTAICPASAIQSLF